MEQKVRDIEMTTNDLRTTHDNNHISLKQSMHKYETNITREGEHLKGVWEEINKLKEINSSRCSDNGEDLGKMVGKLSDKIERYLNMDLDSKLNQIRVNTE
jgi:hypothetical protein